MEEKLLNLGPIKHKYNNFTQEERKALYDLRNDGSIIIKEANKGSVAVNWDKEDHLKEAEKQLSWKWIYEEVIDDPSYLIDATRRTLGKILKRGDIDTNTLKHCYVEEPKFVRFYLLPKIHKRLHSVPGRPVIPHSRFYKKNISAFSDLHLKPTAAKVKSYIKDTNDCLRKLQTLPKLSDDVILCTTDLVGLYPNIPKDEVFYSLKKHYMNDRIKLYLLNLL